MEVFYPDWLSNWPDGPLVSLNGSLPFLAFVCTGSILHKINDFAAHLGRNPLPLGLQIAIYLMLAASTTR